MKLFKKRPFQNDNAACHFEENDIGIIGRIPKSVIYGSIIVSTMAVVTIVVALWFIKYPDIISAPIVITSSNPPANIVSNVNGVIEQIFVNNNDIVVTGQKLFLIKSSVNYQQLLELQGEIGGINWGGDSTVQLHNYLIGDYNDLGELQSYYGELRYSLLNYRNEIILDSHGGRMSSIKNEIFNNGKQIIVMEKQLKLMKEEYKILEERFTRGKLLHDKNYISKEAFSEYQTQLIEKNIQINTYESTLLQKQLDIELLKNSLNQEILLRKSDKVKLILSMRSAYDALLGQIRLWKEKYLITSPLVGNVVISKYWAANQKVSAGENLLMVVPPKTGNKIIGRATLEPQRAGKIKPEQKVNIKLSSYPYEEYGYIAGKVSGITQVPENGQYVVQIAIPDSFITSSNKKIEFKEQLQGTVDIMTENLRLLERLFKPLRDLMIYQ